MGQQTKGRSTMMETRPRHEQEASRQIAQLMCAAARTAPKAKGTDNIVTAIVADGEEKQQLIEEMKRYGQEVGAEFFSRDAENLKKADVCVLIGTKLERLGIPGCNLCGYDGCTEAERAGARCAYNAGDLGIAIGSAVSVAADHRADNRVMYTIGMAATNLKLLGPAVAIAHGIPISIRGKNIFFDRG
jgi:uncharacterized ferredoxin-like protein